MSRVALWDVSAETPNRLSESAVNLEAQLEGWIEADPTMLQSGLEIIGRQLTLEAGRLDLLAIDPQARLCLIEIKRGTVTRDTVAQALDYAGSLTALGTDQLRALIDGYLHTKNKSLASLLAQRQASDALDAGQRQVVLFLVGVGSDPGLARVASFLSRYEVPLNIVLYDVFATQDGRSILSREVTETEAPAVLGTAWQPASSLDALRQQAEANGIGEEFKTMLDAGLQVGLYPRLWKSSVMVAPPANKTRALYSISTQAKEGRLQAWIGNSVFTEFFPMSIDDVRTQLREEGWRLFDRTEATKFADGLTALFKGDSNSGTAREGQAPAPR